MHLTVTGGAMALLTFHLGVYESTCNPIWPISTDNINIFSITTLIYYADFRSFPRSAFFGAVNVYISPDAVIDSPSHFAWLNIHTQG